MHSNLRTYDKVQTGVLSISGALVKSFTNKNCLNSKISNNIDMKLEPLSKLEMENTMTSKEFEYDGMWANYDVIIILPIYHQSEAIQRPGFA